MTSSKTIDKNIPIIEEVTRENFFSHDLAEDAASASLNSPTKTLRNDASFLNMRSKSQLSSQLTDEQNSALLAKKKLIPQECKVLCYCFQKRGNNRS